MLRLRIPSRWQRASLALLQFGARIPVLLSVIATASVTRAEEIANAVPAIVDPSDAQRAKAKAKERFDLGLALARTGQNWDAALAEFLASRELFPTRSATRNAAVALAQLGRYAESLELYLTLLREFSASIPADERVAIDRGMNAVRARVGELEIRVKEVGVSVVVDGQQRGTTPLADVIRVNAGSHTLRFGKEGFETGEAVLSVAGGTRKPVEIRLRRLFANGTLVVQEATGLVLDAVVDAAIVGKTPWRGAIAPGAHTVLLRGPRNFGTPPSSADVRVDETTILTLSASALDASVHVEPAPSSSTVYIDGVSVGNGIWDGRLPSGLHRFEATAAGHLPFRRVVQLAPQKRQLVQATLERDLTSPLWQDRVHSQFYLELGVGALVAPSLHGSADDTCNCSKRNRPFGALAGLRVGYSLAGGLGVELMGGYLTISESMTRRMTGAGEPNSPTFLATDYHDSTTLRGPMAAISVGYRMLEKKTPLTARVGIGVASLSSVTSNGGTFKGQVSTSGAPDETVARFVSIGEAPQRLLTPFGSTELRLGYRLAKRVTIDVGAAVFLFVPPNAARAGTNSLANGIHRADKLDPGGTPGVMRLPDETVAGTFVAFEPSIGVRVDY